MQDRVCVIAGAGGIGGAIARLFGREGARIAVVDCSPENLATLDRELTDLRVEHLALQLDLAEPGAAERIIAAVTARFSRVDVLCHIAGVSGRKWGDGPLAQCTDEGWSSVLDVNLGAMMRLNRACLRGWVGSGHPGVILNLSSVLGFSFVPAHFDTVAYATSKGAIIAMSRHAAATYARAGIRINVLAPALVDTPMSARAVGDPAIQALLARKQPLGGRPLTDEACARAALYLCSDAAAGVTGVVLPVDAGWCVSG